MQHDKGVERIICYCATMRDKALSDGIDGIIDYERSKAYVSAIEDVLHYIDGVENKNER